MSSDAKNHLDALLLGSKPSSMTIALSESKPMAMILIMKEADSLCKCWKQLYSCQQMSTKLTWVKKSGGGTQLNVTQKCTSK